MKAFISWLENTKPKTGISASVALASTIKDSTKALRLSKVV
jgi:hypothetical protein